MSRTRRIYNSYKKYGRYFSYEPYQLGMISKFSLEEEADPKSDVNVYSFGNRYRRRWHPYAVWCMGNCHYCKNTRGYKRWRQAKHTKKLKELKFNFFYND